MNRAPATAKLNLALVVGPLRDDGRHEVVTVLQRIDLADRVAIETAPALRVEGFTDDTLVRSALERLAEAAKTETRWHAQIWKRVPVAAGLGGGSSDAATALRLANETLPEPLPPERLHELAAELGADVPFFLTSGPQLGTGTGAELEPLELPQDYWVLLLLPEGEHKPSTAAIYADFDGRDGAEGFDERRARLHASSRRGEAADRAGDAPVERPRRFAARRAAARARSLPGGRERCRAGRLRALPAPRAGGRRGARNTAARAHLDHRSHLVRLIAMSANESLQRGEAVEHGTTRLGRWLQARRIRITLWIAVLEGIIVALAHDLSRWTVIAIAVPVLALYLFWGREARSHTWRQILWIAGASQALAVVVVILAFILDWLALLLAAIFAAVALLFLFSDRG